MTNLRDTRERHQVSPWLGGMSGNLLQRYLALLRAQMAGGGMEDDDEDEGEGSDDERGGDDLEDEEPVVMKPAAAAVKTPLESPLLVSAFAQFLTAQIRT